MLYMSDLSKDQLRAVEGRGLNDLTDERIDYSLTIKGWTATSEGK